MTAIANTNVELTVLLSEIRAIAEINPAVLCRLRAIVDANTDDADDAETFRKAFDRLDQGRIYVRICNMRRELRWSIERFDNILRILRANGTIQLCGGDPAHFTAEQIQQSFTDEYGSLYFTMKWKR